MSQRGPVIYGVEHQGRGFTGRALAARSGETEKIQFLCGTQSLRHDNQVHLLDYNDDTGVLDKTAFPHLAGSEAETTSGVVCTACYHFRGRVYVDCSPGEVWHIAACPADSSMLATVYSCVSGAGCSGGVGVWRLEGEEGEGEGGSLKEVCQLSHDGMPRCSVWSPTPAPLQMATVDEKHATLWKLDQSSAMVQTRIQLDSKGRNHGYSCACWNPHHNHTQILMSCDAALCCWDVRSDKMVFWLDDPHGLCVRGADYNPNKPYVFASCGDDCKTKFWDSRKLATPLLTRQDHSHWIWSVQYNLFHDQLVLTASSDSQVVLARPASIASEPLRHIDMEEGEDDCPPVPQKDEVIRVFEEHEDSVYSAVWSCADAWVFASLSYDGRLVINHVPTQEKFAILTS